MPVLPAPLSHQPPSPHPLLCLKRGYGRARGHPELGTRGTGTGRIAQRGPLSRGTTSIRPHRAEGPRAKSQVGTLGNPSWITTGSSHTGSGKIPLGTSPKGRAVGQGQRGGRRERAGSSALLRPSSTHAALALVRRYWFDWSPVCTPCPTRVSTSFPSPDRASSSRDCVTSRHVMPWHPGPPPSLCAGETTPASGSGNAVSADNAAQGACPAGDTRRFPRADGHSEGCRGLPVTF